jgi:hypothetical protein
MKVYETYTEEYLCDSDYVKVIDGIEYIVDIVTSDSDDDNPDNLLQDFITCKQLPTAYAVVVNKRVYNVNGIYDWIQKQYTDQRTEQSVIIVDMLRIPIVPEELQTVCNKYEKLNGYCTEQVKHTLEIPEPRIEFADDIARGDIFLYKNGHYAFSVSWYKKHLKYTFIFGTDDVSNLSTQTYFINVNDIIGYVKRNDPKYQEYARLPAS